MTGNGTNRRVLLRRRPLGPLSQDDVEIVEEPIGRCGERQILLQQVWLTMEPTVRSSLDDDESHHSGVEIGGVIRSGGLGRVVQSRHPDFEPGMWAGGPAGWEEWSVLDGDSHLVNRWPKSTDPLLQIAILNGPGPTAYFGLTALGQVSAGDTVLVSAAAGSTGSLAVQISRNLGAAVIGIAGTDDECRWVEELGAEACLNPRTDDLDNRLRDLRPRGIDVLFDDIGGEVLDIALRRIADGARVVICGPDSKNGENEPASGPSNYLTLVTRGATMLGFKGLEFVERYPEAQRILRGWYQEGRLQYRVDIVEGLDGCVDQLNKALRGSSTGKPLVKVCEDPESDPG